MNNMPRVDPDGAARRLSALIRKRTVSSRDESAIDWTEFEAFRELLPELYPETHRALELTIVGGHAMLYRW